MVLMCLCGNLSPQVGGTKIQPDRNVGCILFVARVLLIVASSLFGLFLEVALDFGKVVSFAPSLETPLASMGLVKTTRHLLLVPAET